MGQVELAALFQQDRERLCAVAYRMLGSLTEAEDAVQEVWLRLSRADTAAIENLAGWLTTVVARVCLDMLRSRKARREQAFEVPAEDAADGRVVDPETESIMADSVGLALLVVLQTLTPAERLAFVMHDMFGLPFEEVASVVGASTASVRQLASRARRRVQGGADLSAETLAQQRTIVDTYLTAVRSGDLNVLLSVLHPGVVVTVDPHAAQQQTSREVRGARLVAEHAVTSARGARAARPALVQGAVGLVVAPQGKLKVVLSFTFEGARIVHIEVIGDPSRLAQLSLGVLA